MSGFLLGAMLVLFALSVPIAVAILLAGIVGIEAFTRLPLLLVPQQMFAGLDRYPLLAIPLFILAGALMQVSGISARLIDLARALVGGIRGGLACSCVLTSMMFAAVSGSSVATTFAVGAILIPAMVRAGYPGPFAASVQASSAELGIIIPPSIAMIVFGISAQVNIGELFVAGVGPGLMIGAALMLAIHLWARVTGLGAEDRAERPALGAAAIRALPGLVMAVVVIGGIYAGVFTPTEASAVAVAYALLVGLIVHRTLTPPLIWRTVVSAARGATLILLIIAAATLLNFLVNRSGAPMRLSAAVTAAVEDPWLFLLYVNAFLLIVGMFVETGAAIIVLAPLLTPIAVSFGIDPVHFGVVMVINLALGMFTPPFGVNLFAVSQISGVPVERLIPYLMPFVGVVLLCLLAITYLPGISLGLRDLLYR
jgi:tripartite ATP-independent transporter DctM subunit